MDSKDKDMLTLGAPIYIHPDAGVNTHLQSRIAYVQEVRKWGVLAAVPPTSGSPDGYYPVRLAWDAFDRINDRPLG